MGSVKTVSEGIVEKRFCGRNEFNIYKKEERGQCGSNMVGQGNKKDLEKINNKVG